MSNNRKRVGGSPFGNRLCRDSSQLCGLLNNTTPQQALIELTLPCLRFQKFPTLFYTSINEQTNECEEIVECASQRGLLISSLPLPTTIVAGNRVANRAEIWLHPDGTLHEYLEAASWETLETGCTQRHYVGTVTPASVSLKDLKEQIDCNLAEDYEDPWEECDDV